MAECKRVRLGEIAEYATNKAAAKFATTDNYVSTENMLPNKGGIGVPENLPSMGQVSVFYAGDILISNIRPYFKKIWKANKPGYCSNDVLVLHCKDEIISEYLYCLLSADAFFEYVMAGAKGTKMPRGDKQHILEYAISLPPLATQKKIAAVLGAIDDKIEANRKICANLEAQAQALFKSWFVDFEPFGGKMPKDWKKGPIYDFAEIIYGAPFKSNLFNEKGEGRPIIRIRDLKNNLTKTFTTEHLTKEYLVRPGDLVVGMDGEFRPYTWGNAPALLNQRVCVFRPLDKTSNAFLYYTIKPQLAFIEATEAGTTVIHIGKEDFDSFTVCLPDNESLARFNSIAQKAFDGATKLRLQNVSLASMRDALLPRLMSGEIDVEKVEVA